MSRHLVALLLVTVIWADGCATPVAIRPLVKKAAPVAFVQGDIFKSESTAREAFGLLRDQSKFPGEDISDIKIGESSIEMDGFVSTKTSGLTFAFSNLWSEVFSSSWSSSLAHGFTAGSYSAKTKQERKQRVIWFSDIEEIQLQRLAVYSGEDGVDYEKQSDGYVCALKLKSGEVRAFSSPYEDDSRRLAAAFSFVSHVAVQSNVTFPRVGVRVSSKDAAIVEMLYGGPFDVAGIPAGAKIIEYEGKKLDPKDTIEQISKIEPGFHTVKVVLPGNFAFKTAQIFIAGDPPPIK